LVWQKSLKYFKIKILKQQQNMRPYRLRFVQSGCANKNIRTELMFVQPRTHDPKGMAFNANSNDDALTTSFVHRNLRTN